MGDQSLTSRQQILAAIATATRENSDAADKGVAGLSVDEMVLNWMVKCMLMEEVPFNYLVPHPHMLPRESLRAFVVDSNWIIAMMEGALSLGGNETFRLGTLNWNIENELSGFLLRSEVVGDYPDMKITI